MLHTYPLIINYLYLIKKIFQLLFPVTIMYDKNVYLLYFLLLYICTILHFFIKLFYIFIYYIIVGWFENHSFNFRNKGKND